jgi:hypothetical protein
LGLSLSSSSWALAAGFDPLTLPVTCQETLVQMKNEKLQFAALSKEMQRARKASDNAGFCTAARRTLTLIKSQNDKLDYCIGDLANAKGTPQSAANQMLTIKGSYRQMIDAAKNVKNDNMHCGLADL